MKNISIFARARLWSIARNIFGIFLSGGTVWSIVKYSESMNIANELSLLGVILMWLLIICGVIIALFLLVGSMVGLSDNIGFLWRYRMDIFEKK